MCGLEQPLEVVDLLLGLWQDATQACEGGQQFLQACLGSQDWGQVVVKTVLQAGQLDLDGLDLEYSLGDQGFPSHGGP